MASIPTIGASTRQKLAEISAMVDNNHVASASKDLSELMRLMAKDALRLLQPEITELINRFAKKRKRDLLAELNIYIGAASPLVASSNRVSSGGVAQASQPIQLGNIAKRYSAQFDELRDRHIFQWATYYRDTLLFVFGDARVKLIGSAEWHQEIEKIGQVVASHAADVFSRGFQFQISRGLSTEFSEIKSISGLQKFLYLVISVFVEQRGSISNARDAEVTWNLASALLTSILAGFGRATYGLESGWTILTRNFTNWLPPLGFCRGSDALSLIEEFPKEDRNQDVYVTLVPMLLGIDRLAHKFHDSDIFLPRLSRLSVGHHDRLDLTLSMIKKGVNQDLLVSSYCTGIIRNAYQLSEALSLRAAVVICQLDSQLSEDDLSAQVLNASEVKPNTEQVQNFSEMIDAELHRQVSANVAAHDPGTLNRNYAREFPLEDPAFRKQFLVQRYSVTRLLEDLESGAGVHLWCSVRRSGKTTAASSLADLSGHLAVVIQTMDHQPHQSEQNIFSRKVTEALFSRKPIAPDFFQSIVSECTLATTAFDPKDKKVVFIVDEYETLFGLIESSVDSDAGVRHTVALPLLSQMVAFASRNLLIFMGQRPDAYLVLSAQNQLSPLVRQYNFPLFEHHAGAIDTEFTQLLRRVLQEQLPFESSFSDAVYQETNGHPYLTVNLMVDFCDWLISTGFRPGASPLDSAQFTNFTRDRLTAAALQRSPHYVFFHGMLAEYASERGRASEPWLSAITSVLQEISRKHPRAFTCSVNSFNHIAAPYGPLIQMTPQRFLASASMSNFLLDQGGQVKPGVRLMARLAASVVPKIN